MRGPALGLWVLLGFGLGCVSTATNSEVPTPSPALAQALVLSGPERMAQGGCAKYDVTVLDQSGQAFSVVVDVTLTLTTGGAGHHL